MATAPGCPRCGAPDAGGAECPRCGVVFAKMRRSPAPPPREDSPPETPERRLDRLDVALLAVLVVAGAFWYRSTTSPPAESGPAPSPRAVSRRAPRPARAAEPPDPGLAGAPAPPELPEPPQPPDEAPPEPAPAARPPADAAAVPEADRQALGRLAALAREGAGIAVADIYAAEDLFAKHPEHPQVRRMIERLLRAAARQEEAAGRPLEAARHYVRATELLPESPGAWWALVALHSRARDWSEAERAARRGLSALPSDAWLHRALATALMRQDRNDEAADVLRRLLARAEDGEARTLLARLERELATARGMAQRTSSHFRLRFEGSADDPLGAAVLRVLEEKYDMLARILDGAPDDQIPVVLYPRQAFREVSDSPGWVGANYNHFDGRIRIGTRDLSAGLVPLDLERTLTHELTHAFVDAVARGPVPSTINEGLAQYLSGRRLGYRLARARTVPGPDGRLLVRDFYDAALSFVEYLLERHRQSSMNDLLRRLGQTRNFEEAFRRAYGETYAGMREEWLRQLE